MPLTITGFGPFPPFVINPSEVLVRYLQQQDSTYDYNIIPTTFKAVDEYVKTINSDTTVLAFGLSATAKGFQLETRAHNQITTNRPDADNCLSCKQKIDENGAEYLNTNIKYQNIEQSLKNNNLPVTLSNNAGDYLCNYFYYKGLQRTSMLFVHIPMIEELLPFYNVALPHEEFEFVMTLEETIEGVRLITEHLS